VSEPAREASARQSPNLWLAGLAIAVVAAAGGAVGGVVTHLAWPGSGSHSTIVRVGRSGGGSASLFPALPKGFPNLGLPSGTQTTPGTSSAVAGHVESDVVDINTTLGADRGAAAGTGIVVSSSGEVVTNNHVIDGATQVTATDIGNGKTYHAKVIGYDRTSDIAVISLQGASGLATAPLGDATTLRPGMSVTTIGNAGGVGGAPSVAGGTIVALNRSITAGDVGSFPEQLTGLIELNGALEPGDSGGPLVDQSGKVVGMDTAASSSFSFQTSSGQGVTGRGFAIPINEVISISREIVAGTPTAAIHIGASAMLGVLVATNGTASQSSATAPGVKIGGTDPGTPAARAGLVAGDTITTLNGQAVDSPQSLVALMSRHHPGDQVRLSWRDASGNSHTATLKLASGPSD
jgi:S1-C subfamily serine protease